MMGSGGDGSLTMAVGRRHFSVPFPLAFTFLIQLQNKTSILYALLSSLLGFLLFD